MLPKTKKKYVIIVSRMDINSYQMLFVLQFEVQRREIFFSYHVIFDVTKILSVKSELFNFKVRNANS